MKVGLVQPIVGSIGGNDKVLDSLLIALKEHDVTIFTFTKPTKEIPNCKIKTKIPFRIPMFGVYQNFIMPQHDYSDCDIIISTTGFRVKTDKPLIIYDQNNLANNFTGVVPDKYTKGFWKLYFMPYRLISKFTKTKTNAHYVANSQYSAINISSNLNVKCQIIYPAVELGEFNRNIKNRQVCVIGRISPEKNLEKTISILNQVNYPCFIVGNVTKANEAYYHKLKRIVKPHVKLKINLPRSFLIRMMADSKVIFTASKETFGITTVEGIASGCIPIVPDNSAHPEIVIVDQLRYNNDEEAIDMIYRGMDRLFDEQEELLLNHVKHFSQEGFNKNINELLTHFNNTEYVK